MVSRYDSIGQKAKRLSILMHNRIMQENIRLEQKSGLVGRATTEALRDNQALLKQSTGMIREYQENFLGKQGAQLAVMERQIALMNPINVLRRGYSMTSKPDGTLIRSIGEVSPGDEILSHLCDGTLVSKVGSVNTDKP